MTQFSYIFTLFFSLFISGLLSLLAGILVSSGLLAFVDRHRLAAKFPRNRFLGAIVGSSLGMLVPVGLYGNIPVTRRLLVQGVPLSVAISFLVAAPTVNPIAIAATWMAFPQNLRFIFLRVLLAWLVGIAVGSLFSTYPNKSSSPETATETETAVKNILQHRSTLLKTGTMALPTTASQSRYREGNLVYDFQGVTAIGRSKAVGFRLFCENCWHEFLELGSLLALGCGITVVVQFFLPQTQIISSGQSPLQQVLVLSSFGFILSLGSVNNAFFASLLTGNFLNGSLLAFLQISSIFDLKGIGLLFWSFRWKFVVYLLIVVVQVTLLFSLLINFYLN